MPVDPGPCRAHIERWHFVESSGMCVKFIYGGCLGNSNNFECFQDCRRSCLLPPKIPSNIESVRMNEWFPSRRLSPIRQQNLKLDYHLHNSPSVATLAGPQPPKSNPNLPVIDCKLSAWSPWSTCSALCGNGRRSRSRYIIQMPQNGGKPCDKKLSRTQKCKDLPPCPPDFEQQQHVTLKPMTLKAGGGHGNGKANRNNNIVNANNSHGWRTITTTTAASSMMDDEDDSKFSRLLQSEVGDLHPTNFNSNLISIMRDGVQPEMELIGSTSFHIKNGFIYPHNNETITSS